MSTALAFPNSTALRVSSIVPGGSLTSSDSISFGGWFKIDSYVGQYLALTSFYKQANPGETGSYFWFGTDSTAGGGYGTRGVAYYFGIGGGLGGHSTTTVVLVNTWYHWCVSKSGPNWTVYTNGIPQYFDDGSGNPYVNMSDPLDELDTITYFAEPDFPGDTCIGAARSNFVCSKALSQAEVQLIMTQAIPGTGISGFGALGIWPLSNGSDFSSAIGGSSLTPSGPGFTTTSGPSNIDSNGIILSPLAKRRSRGFFC
jgi:hypothetical protein